ncbi:lipoxygenase [Leptolyngbya cf. ectocarpi LEGE 11479]|uniref:Lipoxygenase n=1 Tax=Leptolyngbya cf. ectocarpi LEGE 11479 TaxID=1828722 RepID=A0A928ZQP0_LEPEC|nr:lipoxygenase family protein [Leptolyngbya ectocarpi]MBE9065623.1 lipoxygenase [Leptolyngbya cf. ectocarpi LEGE 11479]
MTAAYDQQGLQEKRQRYQYNYTHIPPVAMADTLSEEEIFSSPWRLMVAKVGFELLVNTIIVNRGDCGKTGAADDVKAFLVETFKETLADYGGFSRAKILWQGAKFMPRILLGKLSTDAEELEALIRDILSSVNREFLRDFAANVQQKLKLDSPKGKGDDIDDFKALFQTIALPAIAYTYEKDEVFASMRVAGPNPVMLQRLTKPQANFPVTEAHYQGSMGTADSLAAAYAGGRLYIADYGILDGAINGSFPGDRKYLYAPLALFAVPQAGEGDRRLRPVAIQCGQNPDEFSILTPQSNPYAWLCAKTAVQVADANFHEAVTHLARTHLFVGPFAIATHRQLPNSHPVSLLLRPHFQGMLAINNEAQVKLIAAGGGVNKILSATIDSARVLAVTGLQTYGFNSAMLPQQLKQRGVDDIDRLPVYPYRDDSILIWDAIHSWVENYLQIYYADDATVQQDTLLQTWAKELVAHNGGRVIDFGEADGQIRTLAYLVEAITLIIFTASAQHAAVNFPQKDVMSFAPAMPTAGYTELTDLGSHTTEADYFKLLPPLSQSQEQLKLLYLLGSAHFTELGQYDKDHFQDSKVADPLKKFKTRLEEITDIIYERNRDRPPYEYLLPKNIPQSINI